MCKPMDVRHVVPVTVDWYGSPGKFGKMWGEKRLLRESEYLLNTMDISSTLSFSPYDSKMVIFSFYRRKTNLERLSNMLRKASSKVWM